VRTALRRSDAAALLCLRFGEPTGARRFPVVLSRRYEFRSELVVPRGSGSGRNATCPGGPTLTNRKLGWPYHWRYREDDNKIELKMAPEETAVILDVL
jgi:hypothetical protein